MNQKNWLKNIGVFFEPENEKDFLEKINLIRRNNNFNFDKIKTEFNRKDLALKMLSFIKD